MLRGPELSAGLADFRKPISARLWRVDAPLASIWERGTSPCRGSSYHQLAPINQCRQLYFGAPVPSSGCAKAWHCSYAQRYQTKLAISKQNLSRTVEEVDAAGLRGNRLPLPL